MHVWRVYENNIEISGEDELSRVHRYDGIHQCLYTIRLQLGNFVVCLWPRCSQFESPLELFSFEDSLSLNTSEKEIA